MRASLGVIARAQLDRKAIRYSLVSAVAVVVSQLVLLVCNGVLDWAPVPSNVTAVAIGSIPSYALNRAWVWGKRGRNDVWREVVPFWAFAFLGLAFSTLLVYFAAQWSDAVLIVNGANLAAFGVLWVAKFFFLDALLFSSVPGEDSELVTP